MSLDLSSFEKALNSLTETLQVLADKEFTGRLTEPQLNAIRAGVIQNFEFTYEISWKFIKRWLEHNLGAVYVDGVSRHELFRIAAEQRLIDDVERWMFFHRARNLTSHTHERKTADEVVETAQAFCPAATCLLARLLSKND